MANEKEIWQTIGEGFVQEYYNQFDNSNRSGLGNLYVSLYRVCLDKVGKSACGTNTNKPDSITLTVINAIMHDR